MRIDDAINELKKNPAGKNYTNFPNFQNFEEMKLPENFESIKDSFFAVFYEKYPEILQKENKSGVSDKEFYIHRASHKAFDELSVIFHKDGSDHRFTNRLCTDEKGLWCYAISDEVIDDFKEKLLLIPLIMHEKVRIFRMYE